MKPHKHAEMIKAWADGAKIEIFSDNGKWEHVPHPLWMLGMEYRIKREPEETVNGWPLFSGIPKKEWVGLTDEEKRSIFDSCEREDRGSVAAMVEAKLKEKNT